MPLLKSSFLRIIVPLSLLFAMTGTPVFSQSFNSTTDFRRHWMFNASGGTSLFFGDIKQYQYVPVTKNENEWRFAGGLQLGFQISPVFGVRAQALNGQLAGTRRPSNLYFEANYIEFNLNSTISIRNIFFPYQDDQLWDVYLVAGIGLTNYNSELMELSTKKVLRKVGYGNGNGINGRTIEGILIGGMGLKFRLTNQWALNLESSNRGLNSDMLDGRESGFKYDVYNYSSLGITFKFGQNKRTKSEEFDYIESSKKTQNELPAQNEPVQPAEIDMLFVAPPVLSQPVEPPKKETPVEPVVKEVVEKVVEKPVIEKVVTAEIEYRVQIRAKYGNAISIDKLSSMYNLPASQIKQNTHNGFFIYTIGSFSNYEAARERRNELRSTNGIVDAFVVAFKSGERLDKLP